VRLLWGITLGALLASMAAVLGRPEAVRLEAPAAARVDAPGSPVTQAPLPPAPQSGGGAPHPLPPAAEVQHLSGDARGAHYVLVESEGLLRRVEAEQAPLAAMSPFAGGR
jgi:hypothetical protein